MIMLLAPESLTRGLNGMELLEAAMNYHLGYFGVVFIAATLLVSCSMLAAMWLIYLAITG